MARKKLHPLKKKLFHFFKPHGIITLVFLVVSLVATIALVTNPNISLDLRNWAASNSCSDFSEPTCIATSGCTWTPEKITNSKAKLCSGSDDCIEFRTQQSCETYSGCSWDLKKTTIPAFCSGTPSTNKTCPNADPYPPGKHGDVSWIGEINYVCNGAVGDWIDCTDPEALKNSPFGEKFDCQSGGSKTQKCQPDICLEDNKLQKCTKTGLLPKYEITDCSDTNQFCSNAECVDRVTCDGFPQCPGDPKIRSTCKIDKDKNERVINPEICSGDEVCKGEDGQAECLAPTAPPPTTYTCENIPGQFFSPEKCDCRGVGTAPEGKNCCKLCPGVTCEANKKSCTSESIQQVCNSKGNGYTYNTCEIGCRSSDGICVETFYNWNGIPPHRVISANENCLAKEEKYQIGGSTWGCKLKTTTDTIPTTNIPTGQKCASANNNASCQSGDCRLFNSGWMCWDSSWNTICVPNTTTCDLKTQKTCNAKGSDYTTQTCGYGCEGNACRTTPIPTGGKCASFNDNMSCQSGDCGFLIIPWGWYCKEKVLVGTDCTKKDKRCITTANVLEYCKNGRWETYEECDLIYRVCGPNGTTYACNHCPVGDGTVRLCTKQEMEDSKR